MSIQTINHEISKLLFNFTSYDRDPLDNSQKMDTFNKFQLYSMVKYSLLWIQIKIIQEIEEPEFSSITFANSYYRSTKNKQVMF